MRYAYPYEVLPEKEGGFFISFPDVPEALSGAADEQAIESMAQDALLAALSFYTDSGDMAPAPSAAHGRRVVILPITVALKLALHDAMRRAGMSNVALAQRLGTDEKSVRRLRDPLHGSRVEAIEAALLALGCRAEVTVQGRAA